MIDVQDLPPPPNGKSGWPWTQGSEPLPPTMPNGAAWPRLSIVTPSFRQVRYVEETIRSVLLQGYPNLQYIIMDGGSADGSVEIIKKYERWLDDWVSEKDTGPANAINKGWQRCDGEIWAWLNSDDVYLPNAFASAIPYFYQTQSIKLVYASALFTNSESVVIKPYRAKPLAPGLARLRLWEGWPLPQPTAFFARDVVAQYGGLDETLHFGFDCEWFLRITQHEKFVCAPETWATYRWHSESKTGIEFQNRKLFETELKKIMYKYAPPYAPRSWPLYLSEAQFYFARFLRRHTNRARAFLQRIRGGTRRRMREYANKLSNAAPK